MLAFDLKQLRTDDLKDSIIDGRVLPCQMTWHKHSKLKEFLAINFDFQHIMTHIRVITKSEVFKSDSSAKQKIQEAKAVINTAL